MQKFFFDMKDGVPMRDRVGIEFPGNVAKFTPDMGRIPIFIGVRHEYTR